MTHNRKGGTHETNGFRNVQLNFFRCGHIENNFPPDFPPRQQKNTSGCSSRKSRDSQAEACCSSSTSSSGSTRLARSCLRISSAVM